MRQSSGKPITHKHIISELVRPQPNPGVLAWSAQISSIFLSVITLEEIAYGLAAKPNARV